MKEQIKNAVEYWLSSLGQHRHETRNMSLTLATLCPEDLRALKTPTDWFLDFAPFMFRVVAPKHHAELRTTIAYLSELKYRQQQAWKAEMEKNENLQHRFSTWLEKNGITEIRK